VLSPAEADRIYAATGVYQRAPRLPLQPRATTLDGFQEARLLQPGERLAQITIPAIDPMLPDASIAPPVNPPAPGIEYQRDLRGFIMAMPDGTVTPDGVVIYAGAPVLQPPPRPGSEVEAPVPVATAPVAPALDPETGIILVAGRPPLIPPVRPDGLAPEPTEDAIAPAVTPEVDSNPLAVDPAIADAVTAAVAAAAAPVPPATAPEVADDVALNIIAGAPPRRPPLRPAGFSAFAGQDDADATDPATDDVTPGAVALASFRPAERPDDADPPAAIFADPALAAFRPAVRPRDFAVTEAEPAPDADIDTVLAAIAEAAPESAFENVTARAIAASPRPDTRPRNFAQVVARAQANIARRQTQAATVASAPATASRPSVAASAAPAQPSGNVPRTVAQAATIDNAIRLRDMNLIGVYGRPNARRALVRMGNGRYVKVEVGSSLDGGRVTAIGDSALNFVKRGRTYALQLPQS
jgi:type IV pilus biogenesis protein PilP